MLLSNRHRAQEILYGNITEFWSRVDVSACVDMNRYWDEFPGGLGTPHMKGVGMLVGNFEWNP